MFWRELIDRAGPCDETYFFYWEDNDFCYKAKALGYRILHIPTAISYHRRGATLGVTSPRARYFLSRGRVRFVVKYSPISSLLLALLLVPILDVLATLFTSLRAYVRQSPANAIVALKETLRGLWWALSHLKMHFQARQEIQSLAKHSYNTMSMEGI
jgi:GT2 family glycosyltransferase